MEAQEFIAFFLIASTVLNFGIATLSRWKTGHTEFNTLIYYWVSLLCSFGAVGALSGSETQIAFAFFPQMVSTYIMASFLSRVRNIRVNYKLLAASYLGSASISTYMLLWTDAGFTLSLLPICTSMSLAYVRPIWDVLVKNWQTSHWIEKALAIVYLTSIVNIYNYAFFRLDPESAWWGWSVSFAQYQSLSIFLFLLVNNRREQNERRNLQATLELMTGRHESFNFKIDELYGQLELRIAEKDHLLTQLRKSNQDLEEEQRTNELLIQTISHDIATPLTVIGAYNSMFLSGKVTVEDSTLIHERIRDNVASASGMIYRIRDAIVTRSKAKLVHISDVSVETCVKKLTERFVPRLAEKCLELHYETTDPTLRVLADETALVDHVLSNVLSNAIKFSFAGGKIYLSVSADPTSVQISCRDEGVGIEELRLNQKLLRSTPGTNGETGIGFGNLIRDYFLRNFEGSQRLVSHTRGPERGTEITITLKRANLDCEKPAFSSVIQDRSHQAPPF